MGGSTVGPGSESLVFGSERWSPLRILIVGLVIVLGLLVGMFICAFFGHLRSMMVCGLVFVLVLATTFAISRKRERSE